MGWQQHIQAPDEEPTGVSHSDTSLGTGKAVLENKTGFACLVLCAATLSFGRVFVFCIRVHWFVQGFRKHFVTCIVTVITMGNL